MTRERKIQLVAAFVIVGSVSGAILYRLSSVAVTRTAEAAPENGTVHRREVPRVLVVNPTVETITRVVRLAAEVKPYREAMIYGKVAGYAGPPVEVGTRVDPKGRDGEAVLLRIAVPELDAAVATADSRVARATAAIAEAKAAALEAGQDKAKAEAHERQARGAIHAAKALLTKAEANLRHREIVYNRLTTVIKDAPRAVARDKLDEARGDYEVAQADVEVARVGIKEAEDNVVVAQAQVAAADARIAAAEAAVGAALAGELLAKAQKSEAETLQGFGTIHAPFKGVVSERMVDTGTLVKDATRNSGATALFRVVDDSKMRIRFFLAPPDAPHCEVGSLIKVRIDELGDESFDARVARIADALDPKTRTMEVEAELDNSAGKLRAHMFARVEVSLESYEDALVLPARCVTTKKRKSTVLVVNEKGVVEKTKVVIGVDDGHKIQILDGVGEDSQVIYGGGPKVADGERAEPVMKEASE